MSRLARQQQALLQALWAPSVSQALPLLESHLVFGDATLRGLRAYRGNAQALAQQALAAAFPTVTDVLGADDFGGLAREHWKRFPPACGDIAHWGGDLPRHIESIPALVADEPQLADIARIDWALHRAAFAADAAVDLASLQLLVERDPAQLTLRLAPGTACIANAVVWRDGLAPRVRPALEGEARFIGALQERRPLPDALLAAPEIDFAGWLAGAVPAALVIGAEPL